MKVTSITNSNRFSWWMRVLFICLNLFVCDSGKNAFAGEAPPPDLSNWIVSPNGGGVVTIGNSITVNVNSSLYSVSTLVVELYKGATLVWGPSYAGMTNRTIPTTGLSAGDDYKVKIYNASVPTEFDWSNSNFTLSPATPADLTNWLTSPNGGETFTAGNPIPINVNSSLYSVGTLVWELYRGSTMITVSYGGMTGRAINTSSLESGNDYRLKIYNYAVPTEVDWSNGTFTIEVPPSPDLTNWLTAPNGGEVFNVGGTLNVNVNSSVYSVSTLAVELYDGATRVWGPNHAGMTNRTIPTTGLPGSINYKVKVYNAAINSHADWSNGTFRIGTPDLTNWLVTPNGGETIEIGTPIRISLNSSLFSVEALTVELYKGSTLIYGPSTAGMANRSIVTSGLAVGNDYKIKVYNASVPSEADWSNANFSVVTPVVPDLTNWLVSPNGGEIVTQGNALPLNVDASLYSVETLVWEVYRGSTMVYGPSYGGITNRSIQTGTLEPGSDYKVKIYNYAYPSAADWSNGTFTIAPAPPTPNLTNWLVSPSGGEVFAAGETINVNVNSSLYSVPTLAIELYRGTTLVRQNHAGMTNRQLSTVGLPGADNYKVKIYNAAIPSQADWSNEEFTIGTPPPDLTNWLISPNGGQRFNRGSPIPININASLYTAPTLVVELYKGSTMVVGPSYGGMTDRKINNTNALYSGDDYRIKIYNGLFPEEADWSDEPFSVVVPGTPIVRSASSCTPGTELVLSAESSEGDFPICGKSISHGWFLAEAGGNPVAHTVDNTGTCAFYRTQIVVTSPATYWVEAIIDGARSPRVRVTATYYPESEPPVLQTSPDQVIRAQNGVVKPTLTASGGYSGSVYKWYESATGGNAAFTGATFTPTIEFDQSSKGVKTYYVGGTLTAEGGCPFPISPRKPVSVIILGDYLNIVKTTEPLVPASTLTTSPAIQNITFLDGLGRSVQSINIKGSPSGKDIIQPIQYDAVGREAKNYLPYTDGTSGWFKDDALQDPITQLTTQLEVYRTGKQYQFYKQGGNIAIDDYPYAVTFFENSPLNRPVKEGAAGEAWQAIDDNPVVAEDPIGSGGGGHGQGGQGGNGDPEPEPDFIEPFDSPDKSIKKHYGLNDADEVLNLAYVDPSPSSPFGLIRLTSSVGTSTPVYHQAGSLVRTKTKDSDGRVTIEYQNSEGQILLRRIQAVETPESVNGSDYANTYYVYDAYNRLTCVIPPEAADRLLREYLPLESPTDTQLRNDFLDRWAFRYSYDARGRMTKKQVPGVKPVYMIYDDRDRLVLTQDGEMRIGNKWQFTKYDALNRPVLTGIHTAEASLTQAEMQARVNAYYSSLGSNGGAWHETFVGNVANNVHGYTNVSYPTVTSGTNIVDPNSYLTVTYYDNYNFKNLLFGPYEYRNEYLSQTVNGYSYQQPALANTVVKGLITGTKVKVLDNDISAGSKWLANLNYYDDKYRLVQSVGDNYQGGFDRTSSLYDFVGKTLNTRTSHYGLRFKDQVLANVRGNKIAKKTTGATAVWDAGTASVEVLPANTNGWIEFAANSVNQALMVGLSEANSAITWESIHYKFYLTNSSNGLRVCLNGSSTSVAPAAVYQAGDVFRIERKDAGTAACRLYFYKNGELLYKTTTVENDALLVDVSLHGLSGRVVNIRSNFGESNASIVERRFEYDHAGRLVNTWHKIGTESEVLLSHNTYNEVGQLIDKKLHSTMADASDAKQSLDYRYNIRGWLTSMNNADLSVDSGNDENRDLFGFDLAYNEVTDVNNEALYNGNISAMRWSNFLGLSESKAKAYTFGYDPMNRLTSASFRVKTTSWGTPAGESFSESGYKYDLNGNITNLTRYDERGSTSKMDILSYDYGADSQRSNKLLKVSDTGDITKGFVDGANTGADYTYDANGNMTTDLNKGISTAIIYNHLNLPSVVTKGTAKISYYYDATGRKLSQVTDYGFNSSKEAQYAGDFYYENGMLKFINHDEGRAVVSTNETVYSYHGEGTSDVTTINTASKANVSVNGQTYLKVTATGTQTSLTGAWPIGAAIPVQPGDRYIIRAKGYRVGATGLCSILVRVGTVAQQPWTASLLVGPSLETWIEQEVIVGAVGNLQAGVVWNGSTKDQEFYLNEFEIIKVGTTAPEYQYHMKDHLGNVRLTFTTDPKTKTYTAGFETNNQSTEAGEFLNYPTGAQINSIPANATTGTNSSLLNGGYNGMIGVAKSFSVMPGDTVSIEATAKYRSDSTISDGVFTTALLSALGLPAPAAGETGTISSEIATGWPGAALDEGASTEPKLFVNILIFDKDYKLLDAVFNQTTGSGSLMSRSYTIKEPGYVFMYVSNENPNLIDAYFDDVKMTVAESPVVQVDDYYPFGLTYNSYSRESSIENKYKFQGQEHTDDLNLGWDSFKWRNHQSDIGRFFNVDPIAEKFYYNSPYAFSENKVVAHVELEGLEAVGIEPIDVVNAMTPKPETTVLEKFYNAVAGFFTIGGESTDEQLEGIGIIIHSSEGDGPDNKFVPKADPNSEIYDLDKNVLDAANAVGESPSRPTPKQLGEKIESVANATEKANGGKEAGQRVLKDLQGDGSVKETRMTDVKDSVVRKNSTFYSGTDSTGNMVTIQQPNEK